MSQRFGNLTKLFRGEGGCATPPELLLDMTGKGLGYTYSYRHGFWSAGAAATKGHLRVLFCFVSQGKVRTAVKRGGHFVAILLQIISVSVCQKLSKYNVVRQSYLYRNLCRNRPINTHIIFVGVISNDLTRSTRGLAATAKLLVNFYYSTV